MKNIENLESAIFKELEEAKGNLAKLIQEKEAAAGEMLEQFAKEKETADKKVAEINAVLSENKQKYEEIYARYKKALVQNQEQEILGAEEAIRELEREKIKLDMELSALSDGGYSIDIKKFISDYRKTTVQEIEEAKKAQADAEHDLLLLSKELEHIINKIDRITHTSNLINQSGGVTYGLFNKMISIYELKNGVIDISGHLCGDPLEAKRRFINGQISGIENTVAGKRLQEELQNE